MSAAKEISTIIPKNDLDQVRISLETYKDVDFLNIRHYYRNDRGEWLPTKRGICISPNKIHDLINALQVISDSIDGGRLNDN